MLNQNGRRTVKCKDLAPVHETACNFCPGVNLNINASLKGNLVLNKVIWKIKITLTVDNSRIWNFKMWCFTGASS